MKRLQRERNLSYLFIAHDLAMVKHISDRIGVMYLGNLVELTTSDQLYKNPKHPYTQALLSAIPVPDPDVELSRERIQIEGDVPSPINPPAGCVFRTRCPLAKPVCAEQNRFGRKLHPNIMSPVTCIIEICSCNNKGARNGSISVCSLFTVTSKISVNVPPLFSGLW